MSSRTLHLPHSRFQAPATSARLQQRTSLSRLSQQHAFHSSQPQVPSPMTATSPSRTGISSLQHTPQPPPSPQRAERGLQLQAATSVSGRRRPTGNSRSPAKARSTTMSARHISLRPLPPPLPLFQEVCESVRMHSPYSRAGPSASAPPRPLSLTSPYPVSASSSTTVRASRGGTALPATVPFRVLPPSLPQVPLLM